MSSVGAAERLLTFDVGGHRYALPIAHVFEVVELGRLAAVPTLPRAIGGVMNHHGDALPIVHRDVLLDVDAETLTEPQHVLVLAPGDEEGPELGLPVDRVCGLVDGVGATALGADAVAERRPIEGRVVSVLDTVRLLERAAMMIERSVLGADAGEGAER
ncbi:MAG: chemotaxis protein CheW [Myxococcales bacterium]|nr:chemotaxis protein CheW [Myxococcales bacterium]